MKDAVQTFKDLMGWIFLVGFILSFVAPAWGQIDCGAAITSDVTLNRDLECKVHGIIVGRDGVTLDLGGHTITGPGKGPWTWPGQATASVGVRVSGRKGVVVKNGTLKGFATPLLFEDSRESRAEGVVAMNGNYGIYLYRSSGITLSSVHATYNVYGIHLQDSDGNWIVRSASSRNGYSPGGYGMVLYRSNRNTITENSIENNETWGIWVINSRENIIYRNNLINNKPNAVDEPGANSWYNPTLKEGDFWSDHKGGRVYTLGGFGGSQDLFPLSEKLVFSGR